MRSYELHAHAKVIQRSAGRSSVAAAAYRSASKLYDERTGLCHDYTKKQDVEYARVYTPKGAPDWAADRSKLWNAAEAKENRKNSQTSREWEVAYPFEFNAMQRREAHNAIAQEIVRRLGVIVDGSLHKPHPRKEGNDAGEEQDIRPNNHSHFLFTTRAVDASQPDGWAKNKYRDYGRDRITVDGEKITRGEQEIRSMRAFAAQVMNAIAARDGIEVHTEHLSFEERGVEREPTQKLGAYASGLEKRGEKSERGDINRDIRALNDNRAEIKKLLAEKKIIDLAIERKKRELAGAKQKKAQGQKPQAAPANDRQPQAGKPDREAALVAARDAAAAQVSKAGGFWSRLFRRRDFETACTRKQEAEKALSDYRAAEAQTKAAGQLKQQERRLQEANRLAEDKAQAAAAARERTLEENKGFFRRTRSLQVAAVMAEIENAKVAARRDVLDRGPEFWGQVEKELAQEEQEIKDFYHVDAIRADLQAAQLSLRRAGGARSAGQEQEERIASLQLAFKNAESREAEALARVRAERTAIEKALEERQAQRHAAKAPQPEDRPEAGQGIGRLREEYRRTLQEPGMGQESQPPTGEQQQPGGGIGTLRQDLPQRAAPDPALGIGTLRAEYRQQLAEHQEKQQAGETASPDAGESQHVDLD